MEKFAQPLTSQLNDRVEEATATQAILEARSPFGVTCVSPEFKSGKSFTGVGEESLKSEVSSVVRSSLSSSCVRQIIWHRTSARKLDRQNRVQHTFHGFIFQRLGESVTFSRRESKKLRNDDALWKWAIMLVPVLVASFCNIANDEADSSEVAALLVSKRCLLKPESFWWYLSRTTSSR